MFYSSVVQLQSSSETKFEIRIFTRSVVFIILQCFSVCSIVWTVWQSFFANFFQTLKALHDQHIWCWQTMSKLQGWWNVTKFKLIKIYFQANRIHWFVFQLLSIWQHSNYPTRLKVFSHFVQISIFIFLHRCSNNFMFLNFKISNFDWYCCVNISKQLNTSVNQLWVILKFKFKFQNDS